MISPGTLVVKFDKCQFLAILGLFVVFLPKLGVFRKSIFSQCRSNKALMCLGVLGVQDPRLYGGTILGCVTHLGGPVGH